MKELILFLAKLEENKIYYRLNKVRESIMVEIVVPGERWEVEFFEDGNVDIEKFISSGEIYKKDEITTLFEKFGN